MIQVNAGNVFTIALAGMLGYAVLAGVPKLVGLVKGGSGSKS